MHYRYYCPKCNGTLNPNTKIILRASFEGKSSLILFHTSPGNYEAILSDDLALKRGNMVDLSCPICTESLVSRADKNLAEIGFFTDDGVEGMVEFSRKYGEQATFFVTRESIRSYGHDADLYGNLNFMGVSLKKDD